MKTKYSFCTILILLSILTEAQLYLGKTEDELVAALGNDYTKVSDKGGNKVIVYVTEIKDHPKFGNYTLYSTYVLENDSCVMQQTLVPGSQLDIVTAELNSRYQNEDTLVWKSKDGTYYVIEKEKGNLRMKIMKESIYKR